MTHQGVGGALFQSYVFSENIYFQYDFETRTVCKSSVSYLANSNDVRHVKMT